MNNAFFAYNQVKKSNLNFGRDARVECVVVFEHKRAGHFE